MGAKRQHGAIVLEIFGWVDLGFDKLRNFELIGVGEEQLW